MRDGDQIRYEIQAQGGEVSASALENDDTYGNQYGRVLYTHGPGIDAPLDIIRMGHAPPLGYGFDAWGGPYPVLPFGDWRGTFVGGTTAQGVKLPCDATYCLVGWPGKRYRAFLERDRPVHQQNFFGSLTTGQENSNGLMYMRNRYYNPLTGAFTQDDPIGLAGGLNTYGYAAGNPVSYSDPYGLKAGGCHPPFDLSDCPQAVLEGLMDATETALGVVTDFFGIRSLGEAATGISSRTGERLSGGRRFFAGALATIDLAGNLPAGPGVRVASRLIDADGALRVSETVGRHLAGERSYIPVNAILETVRAGERIPDPQGVANHFMYRIGSGKGMLEVLVDEANNVVNHVMHTSK